MPRKDTRELVDEALTHHLRVTVPRWCVVTTFNQMYVHAYPAESALGSWNVGSLGTTPDIEACISGDQVTLRADANNDGIFEVSRTATTSLTGAGLAGVMTHVFSPMTTTIPTIDNVCWITS